MAALKKQVFKALLKLGRESDCLSSANRTFDTAEELSCGSSDLPMSHRFWAPPAVLGGGNLSGLVAVCIYTSARCYPEVLEVSCLNRGGRMNYLMRDILRPIHRKQKQHVQIISNLSNELAAQSPPSKFSSRLTAVSLLIQINDLLLQQSLEPPTVFAEEVMS